MNFIGQSAKSVVIIGGGASGVLLAAHLLRDPDPDLRVTLLERQGQFGQGLAYSARHRDHRVNVPARGMSAFADDPEHFWRWLQRRHPGRYESSWVFVARRLYGTYLEELLGEAGEHVPGRLRVLSEEAVALHETEGGVEVLLANGTSLASHSAVLAVGHETQPARGRGIAVRVGSESDTPLDPDAPVMILGSGLSMVDAWVGLCEAQHRGPITVVSRNGLLPTAHRDVTPLVIDAADVPFGASMTELTHWFRALVEETTRQGGDWRSVVDGLRPYNQRLWQSWPGQEKRRFLRHLRPWWNIHRHRLPPDLHAGLVRAIAQGQVKLVAAEFVGIEQLADGVRATIRRRGGSSRETMDVARVYDCGGVSVDVRASGNPLIRQLVQSGRARPDTMCIGLDVDDSCALIAEDGQASSRTRVVGPLTRGRYFEIEAVPDIRVQCANVARSLLAPAKV
ncbi:MAG: FAD/NAD(P)-binding protein [Devosia sp.]|nr:FAD/NAD(P)-binding protein [Devosia sp.]